MTRIKAILFDLDGVLVDAKDWHYHALNQALADAGYKPIGRQEHLKRFDGLPTYTKLRMLAEDGVIPNDRDLFHAIYKYKQGVVSWYIKNKCKPKQVNESALASLKADGYKLACCSNAIRNSVMMMLVQTGYDCYFDSIWSNEDVQNPKPNPEMYIKAMEKLGVSPSECLIVEDNKKGFDAAIASGAKLMKVGSTDDVTYENITDSIMRNEELINIVIPMAGEGSRFAKEGYTNPKPFIPVDGVPMIKRVIDGLGFEDKRRLIFIVRDEHYDEYIDQLQPILEENSVVIKANKTEGAACTVLHARHLIDNDDRMMIVNSDQFIYADLSEFVKGESSILTFLDTSGSKKWSYAQVVDGKVVGTREKIPISSFATVGAYFFKRGRYFVDAALDMIVANDRHNNEFYVCPVYNYIIKKGIPVTHMLINNDEWDSVGTPELLVKYLRKKHD